MSNKEVTPEENNREIKILELLDNPLTRKILLGKDEKIEDLEEKVKILSEGFKALHKSNKLYTNTYCSFGYDHGGIYERNVDGEIVGRIGTQAREAENNEAVKKALEVMK